MEVEYAINSVSRDRANAGDLLSWWRGHWGIENQLHWVRDATFGEDRSHIRTGHAPKLSRHCGMPPSACCVCKT